MSARTLLRFEPWPGLAMPWLRLAAWLKRVHATRSHDSPDAAALRDLGIHASEWASVQAEAAGRAAPTRRRIVR
jgi:hypothetical protein